MVVEIIKDITTFGCQVSGIIGYEDSSTIHRARREVDVHLEKYIYLNDCKRSSKNAPKSLLSKRFGV